MGEGELKQDIASFFKANAIYIIIALAIIILLTLILFLLLNKKRNKKIDNTSIWLTALGEKDNILETNAVGSRLTLKLLDPLKINEEELKKLGVTSIIKMSNKITLVVEDKASEILAKIK